MRKVVAALAASTFLVPVAAQAATTDRPTAVSYAAQPAGALPGGARVGATTRGGSKLDDSGTTIIVGAAAAVGGYFLHDIIDDDDDDVVSPKN